jgi:hypothetical protein
MDKIELIPGSGDVHEKLTACRLRCVRLETRAKKAEAEVERLSADVVLCCGRAQRLVIERDRLRDEMAMVRAEAKG